METALLIGGGETYSIKEIEVIHLHWFKQTEIALQAMLRTGATAPVCSIEGENDVSTTCVTPQAEAS